MHEWNANETGVDALAVAMKPGKIEIGLFVLRLGLGSFLLLWSLDKLVEPETTTKIFGHFYHLTLSANAVVVGVFESLLSLAIMAGLGKRGRMDWDLSFTPYRPSPPMNN